ncbi:hypothetical protein GF385_01450 [Candidatus Dependentiae bacterium]|nr:hypothetical protein [Candidatus Dependentiae bacterium]
MKLNLLDNSKKIILFFCALFLFNTVYPIRFFFKKKDTKLTNFKSNVCKSIETGVQAGGLFRNQEGFRRADYINAIKNGVNSFFENAGPGLFSKIRSNRFEYDETVYQGIISSIYNGESVTHNSLRDFLRNKENSKELKSVIVKRIKKIKRMSWPERFKLGLKWGIPYTVIAAGLIASIDALRFYSKSHDPVAIKTFFSLFIPSVTSGYYLASRGLKNGLKRSLLINGVLWGGSLVYKGLKDSFWGIF